MPPECITSINGAEAALSGLEKIAKESVGGAPEAKSEAAMLLHMPTCLSSSDWA
jgi:hypothetical protein